MHDERMIFASMQGPDGEHNHTIHKTIFSTIEFPSDVLLTGVMVDLWVGHGSRLKMCQKTEGKLHTPPSIYT
jgi:hypothetical protein